jgi:hypothetical protein
MRLVFEHLLLPGIFLNEPAWSVSIQYNNRELGVFGFNVCSEEELGTGILCRACELMRVSMVNTVLNGCRGVIMVNDAGSRQQTVFVYDENNFTFKEK